MKDPRTTTLVASVLPLRRELFGSSRVVENDLLDSGDVVALSEEVSCPCCTGIIFDSYQWVRSDSVTIPYSED